MTDTEKQKAMDTFLEQVRAFTEVTPEAADELLTAKEGNIVFIGRESCPYSRRFAGTLTDVVNEYDLDINFLHSRNPDYEDEIQEFRDKYDVPTVPGFLYSSESAGILVKCDSSMNAEEILEMIEVE